MLTPFYELVAIWWETCSQRLHLITSSRSRLSLVVQRRRRTDLLGFSKMLYLRVSLSSPLELLLNMLLLGTFTLFCAHSYLNCAFALGWKTYCVFAFSYSSSQTILLSTLQLPYLQHLVTSCEIASHSTQLSIGGRRRERKLRVCDVFYQPATSTSKLAKKAVMAIPFSISWEESQDFWFLKSGNARLLHLRRLSFSGRKGTRVNLSLSYRLGLTNRPGHSLPRYLLEAKKIRLVDFCGRVTASTTTISVTSHFGPGHS